MAKLSDLPVVKVCPLGKECEVVLFDEAHKPKAIQRCNWLVEMRGEDPTTKQERDESQCAMGWLPLLLVENARRQVSTTAAVESLREEGGKATMVNQQLLIATLKVVEPELKLPFIDAV